MSKRFKFTLLCMVILLSGSFAWGQPQKIISAGDMNCYGGGVDYKSRESTISYHLSDFYKSNPKCIPPKDQTKHGENFTERKISVDQIVDKMIKAHSCDFMKDLLITFKKARDSTYEHVKKAQPKRMKNIKTFMEYIKSDLHVEQAALARDVNFCGSSDISFKIWPYWFLLSKLKEMIKLMPTSSEDIITSIEHNGQRAQTCKNVFVRGEENLNQFYVNIPTNLNGAVSIKFNAFQIPDQLSIYTNGKVIHDTKCISNSNKLELDKSQLKDIRELEFRVKAKCNGDKSTVWDIKVDCELEKQVQSSPKASPCYQDLSELILNIEAMIKTFYPIQDFYWMNLVCYHEYDGRLKSEFAPPPTLLQVLIDNQCQGQICAKDNFKKLLDLNSSALERKPVDTQTIKANPLRSNSLGNSRKTYFHKLRYLDNRELYCKDIRNRLSLFSKLSMRYCLSAYPILLEHTP